MDRLSRRRNRLGDEVGSLAGTESSSTEHVQQQRRILSLRSENSLTSIGGATVNFRQNIEANLEGGREVNTVDVEVIEGEVRKLSEDFEDFEVSPSVLNNRVDRDRTSNLRDIESEMEMSAVGAGAEVLIENERVNESKVIESQDNLDMSDLGDLGNASVEVFSLPGVRENNCRTLRSGRKY